VKYDIINAGEDLLLQMKLSIFPVRLSKCPFIVFIHNTVAVMTLFYTESTLNKLTLQKYRRSTYSIVLGM